MTAPSWPVTPAQVRAWTGDTSSDDGTLDGPVAAVNAFVPLIPGLAEFMEFDDVDTFDPPADVIMGAIMYAARLHSRRGSTLGIVTGYADFAGTVVRFDPDIARLLRLGSASGGFVFGAPTSTAVAS